MLQQRCAQCGFHHDDYDNADTASSQTVVPAVLAAAIEGLGSAVLARPDGTGASIADRGALAHQHASLALAEIYSTLEVDAPASAASVFEEMRALLTSLDADQWNLLSPTSGMSVGWIARESLHHGFHMLAEVGRQRASLGLGAGTQTGTVCQLSVSNGGVPKQPVSSAMVTPTGVVGDGQNDRLHHGRPVQAVCLWSQELITSFANQGHPIAAGNAGENITVAGVDWASLLPGSRIDVGGVPMLITAYAIPCAKNARWFADRDFRRILHDRNPGG